MPCGYYLPVLEKKPGALQHGAPFVTWDLPVSIKVVRDRIHKQDKGDRAFVDLLLMTRELGEGGLDALDESSASLSTLAVEPLANCSRYDALRCVTECMPVH